MAATRDLVVQVTADVTGLNSGMAKGAQSLATMEKQARDTERQIKKIGEAGANFQKLVNDFAGVTQAQSGAARASAEAFQEFARLQDAVDDLRGSLDPAYAATKRYEAALGTLDDALARGVISADDHAASVRMLDDGMAGATKGAGGFQNAARGVAQQLSQVGQQTMATGNFMQALAIQLPDIGLAFGAVGAAAGLLAGIALPMVMSAFSQTGDTAKEQADKFNQFEQAVNRVNETAKAFSVGGLEQMREKYGELNAEMMAAIERQHQLAVNDAMQGAADIASTLGEEIRTAFDALEHGGRAGAIQFTDFANSLGMSRDQMAELRQATQDLRAAMTLEDKIAALDKMDRILASGSKYTGELANKIQSSLDLMRQLANSAPKGGWLNAAIQGAKDLASAFWSAVSAKNAATGTGMTSDLAQQYASYGAGSRQMRIDTNPLYNPPAAPDGSAGGGWGGGGGGQNPLDALRQQFATKAQLELDAYATEQQQLQAALDGKVISLQRYQELAEQMQRDHQSRMAEIDVWQYGTSVQKAASFFGDMAQIMEAGGDKTLQIAKSFGAAQALVNAWTGASEALKLPFPGNLLAFGKVLATGFSAVNAIKGAGKGGSTSGGSAASVSTTAAQAPMQVSLTGLNASDLFSGNIISGLLDKLNAEAGDRGYKIVGFA